MSFLSGIGKIVAAPFTGGASLKSGLHDLGLTGGTQQGTQTQTSAPWAPQQPYLQDIFSQAQNLYNNGGLLTPNLSANTQQGMGLLTNNPYGAIPGQFAADTLSGKYLDPSSNPYLAATYNQGAQAVNNSVNSNFEGNNRYGSGAHAAAIAGADANLANDIYGGNYTNERNNQISVAGMAPGLLNFQASNDLTAGGIQDQFNQQRATDPYQKLAQYQGAVSGNYGGVTTSPMYKNTAAGLLGGALAGGKLGATIGGPWGAGIGAIAGGLLGSQ